MLVALMTILFLGGGSSIWVMDYIDDSRGNLKEVVQDEERRDSAKDVFKAMKKRSKDFKGVVKDLSKGVESEISSESVADADLDAVWDEFFAARGEFNKDMLDLRFELKEHLTREEWSEIFSAGP